MATHHKRRDRTGPPPTLPSNRAHTTRAAASARQTLRLVDLVPDDQNANRGTVAGAPRSNDRYASTVPAARS
jgi:hypothetical protein